MPIANVMSNMTTAFYSGFMPTNATFGTTSNVLTYTIPVRDEKPIWFYCSQGRHCQNGMVGAINAYVPFSLPHASHHTNTTTVPHQATGPCLPSPLSPLRRLRTSAPAKLPALVPALAVQAAPRPLAPLLATPPSRPLATPLRSRAPMSHPLSAANPSSVSVLRLLLLSLCCKRLHGVNDRW